MADPKAQNMGNYYRPTNALHVSLGFLLANPVNFNIKYVVLLDLRDKPFDMNATSDPWEHLAMFHETTLKFQLEDITENQVKLKIFNFSLVGRVKDWLLSLLNGVIKTCKELEHKFLGIFFTTTQFAERKVEITHFDKQETGSLMMLERGLNY